MKAFSDMTLEERRECVGMWCKMGESWLIIMWIDGEEVGLTNPAWTEPFLEDAAKITPRFDLSRAWMPDGTPVKDA